MFRRRPGSRRLDPLLARTWAYDKLSIKEFLNRHGKNPPRWRTWPSCACWPTRAGLRILRLLMAGPATLTQLARTLQQSPAWVRHHLLALEAAGLVELAEVRTTGKVTEKFYRARSSVFLLHQLVLPRRQKTPGALLRQRRARPPDPRCPPAKAPEMLMSLSVGSLDGLIQLRQGLCHLSASHLLDESGEYNVPFIRHLFPDREVKVVTLAQRTQGWMLAPGNPKGVRGIEDLARADVRFVNRNPGSGTRLWIDRQLHRLGLDPDQSMVIERRLRHPCRGRRPHPRRGRPISPWACSQRRSSSGLDFIPLFEERYDLGISCVSRRKPASPSWIIIQTQEFRVHSVLPDRLQHRSYR